MYLITKAMTPKGITGNYQPTNLIFDKSKRFLNLYYVYFSVPDTEDLVQD